MILSSAFLLLPIYVWAATAPAQRQFLPTTDFFTVGETVTIQGCVERAAEAGGYVISHLNTWPITTTPVGPYGPRHFWVQSPPSFRKYLGNTIQVTGQVVSVRPSEIELEPGLRRFGRLVEIERPDRYLLVSPDSIGLDLDLLEDRSDVPLTMIEVEINDILEVMTGCLPHPAPQAKLSGAGGLFELSSSQAMPVPASHEQASLVLHV